MAGYSTELRNNRAAAITNTVGANGRLEIYSGTKPAVGGTEGTLLAVFTLGATFAPVPVNGVLSPTLPANTTGVASGTATWARVTKSDGTTAVIDYTCGLSGTEIILNTTAITTGGTVSVVGWTITSSAG